MVANSMQVDPLSPGVGIKIHHFQNTFMLHITLRESQMQKHSSKYFDHRPPPPPNLPRQC